MLESDLIPYATSDCIGAAPALVLAPHPDDEVLGCAGAILSHLAAGHRVDVVIVTDGRLGITDPGISDAEARAIRMRESEQAAAVLGYGRPEFWGYGDRSLACTDELVAQICHRIREGGYRSLFIPSPLEVHPDHRALTRAGLSAARRLGDEQPLDVCLYEVGVPLFPNRLLDITRHAETKWHAIGCFGSQLAAQNYLTQNQGLNVFRSYTLPRDVTHAEGYCVIDAAAIPDISSGDQTAALRGRLDLAALLDALVAIGE